MDATSFTALAAACAPQVHVATAHAIVAVESSFNAHAIGVVGGALERQPKSRSEAIATAKRLRADGRNFSIGLAQINVHNFDRLGLTFDTAFDPCTNLKAMQTVLAECFAKVSAQAQPQTALRRALSCYYSGNTTTGFRHGYVARVVQATPASRLP